MHWLMQPHKLISKAKSFFVKNSDKHYKVGSLRIANHFLLSFGQELILIANNRLLN